MSVMYFECFFFCMFSIKIQNCDNGKFSILQTIINVIKHPRFIEFLLKHASF